MPGRELSEGVPDKELSGCGPVRELPQRWRRPPLTGQPRGRPHGDGQDDPQQDHRPTEGVEDDVVEFGLGRRRGLLEPPTGAPT